MLQDNKMEAEVLASFFFFFCFLVGYDKCGVGSIQIRMAAGPSGMYM